MTNSSPAPAATPIRWVDDEAPERQTVHVETGVRETSGPRLRRLLTPADRVLVWNADGAYAMRLARVAIDETGDVSFWLVRQTRRGTDYVREAGWLYTGPESLRRWGTPGDLVLADDLERQAAEFLAVWAQVEAVLGPLPAADEAPADDRNDLDQDADTAAADWIRECIQVAEHVGNDEGARHARRALAALVAVPRLDARIVELERELDAARARATGLELATERLVSALVRQRDASHGGLQLSARASSAVRLLAGAAGVTIPDPDEALARRGAELNVSVDDEHEDLYDPPATERAETDLRDVLRGLNLTVVRYAQISGVGRDACDEIREYVRPEPGSAAEPRQRMFGLVLRDGRMVTSAVRFAPEVPPALVLRYVVAVRAAGFPAPHARAEILRGLADGRAAG